MAHLPRDRAEDPEVPAEGGQGQEHEPEQAPDGDARFRLLGGQDQERWGARSVFNGRILISYQKIRISYQEIRISC